jgi:D-alanyl-D-alanine carboxypeptidase
VAQDQALQKMVDEGRAALAPAGYAEPKNALLTVKNPDCGTTVYLSGSETTATTTSLWRIASVTKTFTSASVLSLVAEGTISLDDPLSKWVPDVPNTTGVTVRMLLDHRSGIYNYAETVLFDSTKAWTPAEIVAFATAREPYFAPDVGWHYSNTNYVLLGMILEAATGQEAGAVLHARAIDAVGLRSTFFDGYDAIDQSRMTRAFRENGTTDCTFYDNPTAWWAAAAMVSDGSDLASWVAAVYGTDTVLDASHRALLTSTLSDDSDELGSAYDGFHYGLGVMVLDASLTGHAGQGLGHDGILAGFDTQAYYFPDKQTAVVWMVNDDLEDPGDLPVLARDLAVVKALFP